VVPELVTSGRRDPPLGPGAPLSAPARAPARGYLVVLAIVILGAALGIGFAADAVFTAKPQHLPTATNLTPKAASGYWTPILNGGEPPSDVLGGLVVPSSAMVTGYDNLDGGGGQYDRSATFFVPAGQEDVIAFYNVELPALGWKLRGAAPTRDGLGTSILAYRFSTDSFQWQVQVGVEPGNHAGRSGSKLTLEAYQLDDDGS
jgi:hypothetical protein